MEIEAQIAAARRELSMRKRVYPRWVAQDKMKQSDADYQTAAMAAILATLEAVKAERDAKVVSELQLVVKP